MLLRIFQRTSSVFKQKFYLLNYFLNKNFYNSIFNLNIVDLKSQFPKIDDFYRLMHYTYTFRVPDYVKKHRIYFSKNQRGFGENALHAMWWKIFNEFRPKKVLEIGVYRGQVVSLWGLLSDKLNFDCEITGISPFSSVGDDVSEYLKNLDYLEDTKFNIKKFTKNKIFLLQNFSNDEQAINYIVSNKWDLIYIDGSHDFDIALNDYKVCKDSLSPNGIIVLDDSSLYTNYKPTSFSFAGHPGPSKIARDYAEIDMELIMSVGHNNVFRNKSTIE